MMNKKCKYCKHREVHKTCFENFGEPLIKSFSLCVHDQSSLWNPISERHEVMTTAGMRKEGEPCGPDAILWEKKE